MSAVLEARLPARELLSLRAGDVLSLGVPISQALSVKVGTIASFDGRPVRLGAHAGIEVHGGAGLAPAGPGGAA